MKERETRVPVCGVAGDRSVYATVEARQWRPPSGTAGDVAVETWDERERERREVREISCSRDKLEFLIFVLRSSTSRPR